MITYRLSAESLQDAQLHGFFVGWPNPPSPPTHLRMLQQSSHVVIAMDDDTHQAVGFITAISDGVLTAFIPLLEVLPTYQGRGIGSELVRQMLSQLEGLYAVDLLCDAALQPYYEKAGMIKATGMLRRNYPMQSGLPAAAENLIPE